MESSQDDVKIPLLSLPDLPEKIEIAGQKFVLPANGPDEFRCRCTLTNVDKFDVDLVRVTDRTLYRHIALGHIGGELPTNEFANAAGNKFSFAERLWTGTVRLKNSVQKTNKTTRIVLPVRSILKGRLEWLQREIGSNANQAAETSSVWAPLADIDVSLIDVRGQFFAGSLPFESAAAKLITPGAYALLVRNPSSKSANEDCSEPLKQRCGSYLAQWFLNTDIGLSFYEGEKGLYGYRAFAAQRRSKG